MKNKHRSSWLCFVVAALFLFITVGTSAGATFECNPTDDSWVRCDKPGNHGAGKHLKIQRGRKEGFLKFDLTGLSGMVTSAELTCITSHKKDGTVHVHAVADNDWDEHSIEGDNAPAKGARLASATASGAKGEEITWDVTEYVRSLMTADCDGSDCSGFVSLALTMTDGHQVYFSSKENKGGSKAPFLKLQWVEFEANAKDLSQYPDRAVFLVSDQTWQEVMGLVPLAIWTEEEGFITAYPLLIYHKESEGGYDLDAIVDFVSQCGAQTVIHSGDLPDGAADLFTARGVSLKPLGDPLSYWKYVHDVVVVEDNVALSLIAATYASLVNAPVFIEGADTTPVFDGRNVICIGDPAVPCSERYTPDELEELYVEVTGTDKIMITNPDLGTYIEDNKPTMPQGNAINHLYGKTALAAPVLAASKHELLLPIPATSVDEVDAALEARIAALNLKPKYLTILASPLEIQQTILVSSSKGWDYYRSLDNTRYGNLDNDMYGFAELKTGRIYGFTVSDVSAYIARAVFDAEMPHAGDWLFIGQGVGASDIEAQVYANLFDQAGYTTTARTYADPTEPGDWEERALIHTEAHGSPYSSAISTEQIPPVPGTVVITSSCLTCGFDHLSSNNYGRLFCTQLLRKGVTGVIASVEKAGFNWDSTRLNQVLSRDLGTVLKGQLNFDHARNLWHITKNLQSEDLTELQGDIQFLLGDPTLAVSFQDVILADVEHEITHGDDQIQITIRAPSINIEYDDQVFTFMEGTDQLWPAWAATFWVKVGPITLFDDHTVSSPDGTVTLEALHEEQDGTYAYLLIYQKDLTGNPLDAQTVNTVEVVIQRQ